VAIWSNLELFIAIITANLALSRAIYLLLVKKQLSSTPASNRDFSGRRTGEGTIGSQTTRKKINLFDTTASDFGTQLAGENPANNMISSECRRASSAKSTADSDIPLEPGIQMRTNFYMHEEVDSKSDDSAKEDSTHHASHRGPWAV
jgi:hypothetical protein